MFKITTILLLALSQQCVGTSTNRLIANEVMMDDVKRFEEAALLRLVELQQYSPAHLATCTSREAIEDWIRMQDAKPITLEDFRQEIVARYLWNSILRDDISLPASSRFYKHVFGVVDDGNKMCEKTSPHLHIQWSETSLTRLNLGNTRNIVDGFKERMVTHTGEGIIGFVSKLWKTEEHERFFQNTISWENEPNPFAPVVSSNIIRILDRYFENVQSLCSRIIFLFTAETPLLHAYLSLQKNPTSERLSHDVEILRLLVGDVANSFGDVLLFCLKREGKALKKVDSASGAVVRELCRTYNFHSESERRIFVDNLVKSGFPTRQVTSFSFQYCGVMEVAKFWLKHRGPFVAVVVVPEHHVNRLIEDGTAFNIASQSALEMECEVVVTGDSHLFKPGLNFVEKNDLADVLLADGAPKAIEISVV